MAELTDILAGIQSLTRETQTTRAILEGTAERLDNSIQELRTATMANTRELGGVQVALTALSTNENRLDNRITTVEQKQAECPARQDIKGVNARVKKLENFKEKMQEERGEVTGITHNPREFPAQPGLAAAVATATTKDLLVRAIPWLVAALLAGAAIGGFLLRGLLPQ